MYDLLLFCYTHWNKLQTVEKNNESQEDSSACYSPLYNIGVMLYYTIATVNIEYNITKLLID